MNAVAITDHGNLYGAIEFYSECKAAGINPIIGYEAYVAPGKRAEREAKRRGDAGFHLTLLAKNRTGFKNLIKMSSLAFLEGYHYVPRIDKELLEAHKRGHHLPVAAAPRASSASTSSRISWTRRRSWPSWFAKTFGKNFYVEIQNNGLDIQKRCAEGAIDIANRLGLPLVATSDAHYLAQDDASPTTCCSASTPAGCSTTKTACATAATSSTSGRRRRCTSSFPARTTRSRAARRSPTAVDIELDFKTRHFPVFTPPDKQDARGLPARAVRGRLAANATARHARAAGRQWHDRLEHELGIICRMGFASYFLIVWDFVRFADRARASRPAPAARRAARSSATS